MSHLPKTIPPPRDTWKMSGLKLVLNLNWPVAALMLEQYALTYQTSVYVIGFLDMAKEWEMGAEQRMTFRWNSIKSIHIRATEKWNRMDFQKCTHCAEFTRYTLTNSHFESHVRATLHLPVVQPHLLSYSSQAFAIPGQYAFAHQDVSMRI